MRRMSSAIGVARLLDFAKIGLFGWHVGAIGSALHGIDRRRTMIDRPLVWMRDRVSRLIPLHHANGVPDKPMDQNQTGARMAS